MDCISIGVLGSGNVGRTLAAGLAGAGHSVTVGSRTPDGPELAAWGAEAGIELADPVCSAASAEVVILATAWEGAQTTLDTAASALAGKTLIDATNPLVFADGLSLALGHSDSGGEQVQRWAPQARVVKAFNTVGFELMNRPDLPDGPGTLFIAGDDEEAKAVTTTLAADLGWEVHDCGGLVGARLTEPLAMIWIEHAIRSGSRSHALRLIGAGS